MAKWTVRPASIEDAAPLAKVIDAAYAGYSQRIDDLPPVSAGIAEDVRSNLVWVAELDGAVVGGIVLILKNEVATLANVAVDPACAGMGVGRGLIEQVEAACRQLKKRELRLTTHAAIPENVSLYEHLGWRETSRSGNKVQMTRFL